MKNLIAAFVHKSNIKLQKKIMSPFWHIAIFSKLFKWIFVTQRIVQKFILLKQHTTNDIHVNDDLPYIGIKCTWHSYRISDFECKRKNRKMTNRVTEKDNRWHILQKKEKFGCSLKFNEGALWTQRSYSLSSLIKRCNTLLLYLYCACVFVEYIGCPCILTPTCFRYLVCVFVYGFLCGKFVRILVFYVVIFSFAASKNQLKNHDKYLLIFWY